MRRKRCKVCGKKIGRYKSPLSNDPDACARCGERVYVALRLAEFDALLDRMDAERAAKAAATFEQRLPHLPPELHGSGQPCPGCEQLSKDLYGDVPEDAWWEHASLYV